VLNVSRDGTPVTDLQPYLGAAGHVVVLDAHASGFAHVHAVPGTKAPADMGDMAEEAEMAATPASFGPDLAFSHQFAKPGLYKVWSQFQHNGQVHTVAWTVEVR
jgi:Cu+-exporting ATPase